MEILLETFVLFSCLMFWVVFFHKKGTLAKLKKIEASIQSKIHILEDLMDRYQSNGGASATNPQSISATESMGQPVQENLVEDKKAESEPESVSSDHRSKFQLAANAKQLKNRLQGVAHTAKAMAIKSTEHLLSGDTVNESNESKIVDKTISASGNMFEQKIESMLKSHSPQNGKDLRNDLTVESLDNENFSDDDLDNSNYENDDFDDESEGLNIDKIFTAKEVDVRQVEKVIVPRTRPIESFQDVINLSKALEKEQSKN